MAQKQEIKENKEVESGGANSNVEQAERTIRWDDSKMTSTYANVCNVSSSREEVTLLFGTNQSWHTGQKELAIILSNRVILNPFAAKRLATLLNNIMGEYESRFGKLKIV